MSLAELLVTPLGWILRGRRSDPGHSVRFAPELAAPDTLAVTSTSFDAGGVIPRRHSGAGKGDNVSPQLSWSGLPVGTRQLLIIMEDTDVPLTRPIIHMIVFVDPHAGAVDAEGVADGAGAADGAPAAHAACAADGASAADAAGAADGSLAEGALTVGNLAVHYVPAFRHAVGYQGPRPLPGHGAHHYGFHVYALDTVLDAAAIRGLNDLLVRVAGHVLASGVLVGTQRS